MLRLVAGGLAGGRPRAVAVFSAGSRLKAIEASGAALADQTAVQLRAAAVAVVAAAATAGSRGFSTTATTMADQATVVSVDPPKDDDDGGEGPPDGFQLVYTGEINDAIRSLKRFSLVSCVCTVAGSPLLVVLGRDDVPLAGRVVMGAALAGFGISTTALVNLLSGPYIHRLYHSAKDDALIVVTMNLLGRLRAVRAPVSSVDPKGGAMASFSIARRRYFLHKETFEDLALLERLIGDVPEAIRAERAARGTRRWERDGGGLGDDEEADASRPEPVAADEDAAAADRRDGIDAASHAVDAEATADTSQAPGSRSPREGLAARMKKRRQGSGD